MHKDIAVLMGPTGAGKSALALEVAAQRPTVIINADAMQMVAGLRVITARPTLAEEAQAEHALYGVLRPQEPTSVACWLARVKPVIVRAWDEGKLPLLVGGTGMYVKALMEGLAEIPSIPDAVRTRVRALDAAAVRAELERHDAAMAARLKAGDRQRNLRALEVIEATGTSLAVWQARAVQPAFPEARFHRFMLQPPRDAMYARINRRFEVMLAQGALAEVAALAALALPPELPILRAHGVPELLAHLRGEMPLDAAVAQAQQNTRHYAKRQVTWLRNQWADAAVVAGAADLLPALAEA
ncbi:MAG: tRNA (adenosine(37)-N6)-dimethylallyltransferase MiaA [Alphaproteobacteria bacterium]|nr:tRNA (adenosine(37)-N6)-dimethylallyltransferase MiaA [Alphaproteobacteria bacterium]